MWSVVFKVDPSTMHAQDDDIATVASNFDDF